MSRQVACPRCRNSVVLRSRPQSPREHAARLIGMMPFHCQQCSHRFLAWNRGTDHSGPIDRREHLRIPVRLCLSFSGGKVRGEGTVKDLSLGGCVIQSETQVHVDDIFYLEIGIAPNEPPLEVAAMVRSVSARGIALKFLRKAQEDKRLLAFIHSRSGATSSALPQAVAAPIASPLAPGQTGSHD
ncbi:MAG: PilZ domain-containing protein [Nitrospira sp.]|nr:PilZ domain-containing protein [Nitrospira sp.]